MKDISKLLNFNKNNEFDKKTLLFVIGAAKTGTTWLWSYFRTHEQVFTTRPKELNFFNCKYYPNYYKKMNEKIDSNLNELLNHPDHKTLIRESADYKKKITCLTYRKKGLKNEKYYIKYFKEYVKNEKCFTDITPGYCVLPSDIFDKMHKIHSNTKFIFIMRNPVERQCSHIKQEIPLFEINDDKINYVLNHLHHQLINNYKRTIENLESIVPKENILYCFYENLFCDESIKEICDFLEIEFQPGNYEERVMTTPHFDFSQDMLKKIFNSQKEIYEYIFEKFKEKVPKKWHNTYDMWVQE